MPVKMPTIKEKRNPMLLYSSVCSGCANYDESNPMFKVCAAFPNGIPEEIFSGENNHTKPYPGDNGILFEPVQIRLAA